MCILYHVVLCIHSLPEWDILMLGGQYALHILYTIGIYFQFTVSEFFLKVICTNCLVPSCFLFLSYFSQTSAICKTVPYRLIPYSSYVEIIHAVFLFATFPSGSGLFLLYLCYYYYYHHHHFLSQVFFLPWYFSS
jgi:hypothetical protein